MNYLLDANTLIEAKNRYYHMEICPGYWAWVIQMAGSGIVGSIKPILDELKKGNDELKEWAITNESLFVDVTDTKTQQNYMEIAQYVAGASSLMKPGAMNDFLSGADPWLIAKAKTTNATIVTHEVFNDKTQRKFLIPNICKLHNIRYINTFELLLMLEAKFVLSNPNQP